MGQSHPFARPLVWSRVPSRRTSSPRLRSISSRLSFPALDRSSLPGRAVSVDPGHELGDEGLDGRQQGVMAGSVLVGRPHGRCHVRTHVVLVSPTIDLRQGSPELGRRAPVDELLLERQGHPLGRLEDAVPVAVQGERNAVAPDRLAQDGEIAGRILLLAERRPGDDPVASSMAATRVSRDPRSSSQSWRLPSVWRSMPAWGIRSRRLRWRGGRRRRGLAIPAARRIRRTLTRLSVIPSRSASSSARWLSLAPSYRPRARVRTWSRAASSIRRDDARPRLPWTSPAGPSSPNRRLSRQTERTDSPRSSAASATRSSPAITFVNAHARRCSTVVIAIVSLMAGD